MHNIKCLRVITRNYLSTPLRIQINTRTVAFHYPYYFNDSYITYTLYTFLIYLGCTQRMFLLTFGKC